MNCNMGRNAVNNRENIWHFIAPVVPKKFLKQVEEEYCTDRI